MDNNSSAPIFRSMSIYLIMGSVDHLVSVPVNSLTMWLIVSGKRSLFESEFLTLNLVSMEMAFSLCFLLSLLRYFFQLRSLKPLIDFYHGTAVMGRALFQCHICVDRYLAVVHPVVFIRYKQLKYRGACLAAVWLAVVVSGLSNSFKPENPRVISIGSCALLAPSLSIEIFCSLSILRILRRSGPGDKEAGKKEGNKQKMRAMKIICLVLAMLIFNVVPFLILPLLLRVGPLQDMIALVFTMASVGSSAQAFLFLSRAGKLPCKG